MHFLHEMDSVSTSERTARWQAIDCILGRRGPLQRNDFEPSHEVRIFSIDLHIQLVDLIGSHVKLLVVGAGGLGCELLKSLVFFHSLFSSEGSHGFL